MNNEVSLLLSILEKAELDEIDKKIFLDILKKIEHKDTIDTILEQLSSIEERDKLQYIIRIIEIYGNTNYIIRILNILSKPYFYKFYTILDYYGVTFKHESNYNHIIEKTIDLMEKVTKEFQIRYIHQFLFYNTIMKIDSVNISSILKLAERILEASNEEEALNIYTTIMEISSTATKSRKKVMK